MALLPNLSIGAFPNLTAAAVTQITAGAEGSSMQAAGLKRPDTHNSTARLTSVFPHESYWEVDYRKATALQTLALVQPSLYPGDRWRIVAVESGDLPLVRSQTIAPDVIEASSGTGGGTVGDIDEHPSTPDANYIGPAIDGGSWMIQLSFPAASEALAEDAEFQCFAVWVKLSGEPQGPEDYAVVTASLFNTSTQTVVRALGSKAINQASGQLLLFPWDAADGVPDASPNVLRIDVAAGDFPLGTGRDGQLGAVSWEAMHAADVDPAADGPDYDTGWQTVAGGEPEPLFGGAALQQAELPPLIVGRVFEQPETFGKLRFEFRADGLGTFADFQSTPPRTPNGYIDAEVLLSGPLFQAPFRAESLEISHEVKLVGQQRSLAGTSNPVVQARWRKVAADLVVLPTQTAHRLFEWLTRAGPAATFLLLVEPTEDDPPTARNTTMYASLDPGNFARGLRYGSDVEVDGQRCRSLGFEFEERI